jgi:hypothetical protein
VRDCACKIAPARPPPMCDQHPPCWIEVLDQENTAFGSPVAFRATEVMPAHAADRAVVPAVSRVDATLF